MSEKEKTTTVEGAVIVPQQLAKKIVALFDELPRRFSPMIDPILQEFGQCVQSDVTLTDISKSEKPKEEKK